MNLYSLFLGEANYFRKEMTGCYENSLGQSLRLSPEGSPHELALYGALNGWRIQHHRHDCNMGLRLQLISAEIAPFKAMDEEASVEALAEYGVYLNLPSKSRTA